MNATRSSPGRLRAAADPPETSQAAPVRARLLASPETHDDIPLVRAAKQDAAAFAALYDRYLTPVYRFCLSRLGTIPDAEDATAAIFTRALAALPSCQDAHFRPWLFAIARNVVTDVHRAARPTAPIDAAANMPDPAPSPDDHAIHADTRDDIRGLLAHLPPDQRDIVQLRLAGLSGPEIARALDRTHAAIRVGQFRAFARLRALIAATESPPPAIRAIREQPTETAGKEGTT